MKKLSSFKTSSGFTLRRTPLRRNLVNVKGFTLIELLIVIAILGVLAVVVVVAINPVERQAQARDAGRISSVTQLGHALQAYYTSGNATYPLEADWAQDLIDSGNIGAFPGGISYAAYGVTACTNVVQPAVDPTFCYAYDGINGGLTYAKLEATSKTSLCTGGDEAYFVFSTSDGRGGLICSDVEPVPWESGAQTYVQ